ncbi:IQ motif-containing protein H isoform X1 [Pangasianodon hypophthalmus]|uniref:IQ motif-containing protein H isoform X1 n=1 Tax=Pangasianodon hypophthalmus TaxID=310915 RepID=UPI0023078E48|nr:IQ motif-containing protein H isoform X1 [Pangasianodon hypophthalmus]
MADRIRKGDELGRILVQVQNDLTELRKRLGRTEQDGTLDVQAVDAAIRRTEDGIKSRAEEYLKMANKQVLTLPIIEHVEKKTAKIAKWQPPTESIPYIPPQKYRTAGASPGEKHKAAFTLRVLYNPDHPKHRDLMHQNYGIQLPDLHKKPGPTVGTQKAMSSTVAVVPIDQKRNLLPASPLCEEDNRAGLSSRLEKSLPPSAADLRLVKNLLIPQCRREDSSPNKMGKQWRDRRQSKDVTIASKTVAECPSMNATLTPPPTAASDSRLPPHSPARLMPLNSLCAPALPPTPSSQHFFSIVEGRIDPSASDFCAFKERYCLSWSTLLEALWQLERLLCQFAVPHALVCGDRLVALAQSGELQGGRHECLLSALENREEVLELMKQPGQRYKGEGGRWVAAVRIQACWRCYRTRTAYLHQQRRRWAARTIAISWLLHAQLSRVRKSLQATRLLHLENYHSRAKHLAANWSHFITSKRTIIHVPTLGYSQQQRHSLRRFDILQNTQMGRLCDIRDKNVEVIYVCPVHLGEDLIHYYTHLLGLNGAVETGMPTPSRCAKNFTILTPEAHQHFSSHCMCVSTLLKYSPHTLRRIKNLIQGKQAYLVSGVPHMDDLAVADELGVPVLGPEPAVARLYGTKSGIRRIFSSSGVSMPPGLADIYTLQQLNECFAQLMTDHLEVQRWLFKMDDEFGGRGTAYCDVCHVSSRPWALQEYHHHGAQIWRMAWAQERVLRKFLEAVPALLAAHAKPFDTSCYPTWSCFLEHFLRKGGVIEAYPPSDSVTGVTVDLLVEPDGGVRMLSCGDQLRGPGFLQVSGCTVPQSSVSPDVLYSICMRIGKACQERHILGHLSLDLVTFLEPGTLEQQVWAVDLDLGYSNQLAMTQIMLHMTGGTLNCHAGRLEVPSPVRNSKPSARQKAPTANAPAPATSHFAVMSSRLFHTNLSMVHYSVFFQMCKAHGIGFDIKEREGSVFTLHDSAERSSLGMATISPDLQGALLTFARNLTVIHQEISAPNMQGETNFKDLIKTIKEMLDVITQNTNKEHKEKEKGADV